MGTTTQKKLKTNTKTLRSSIWIRPQGPQGCQKMRLHPLNTPFEVWCTKTRIATGMDGTLHTDFPKSETSRDIKKSF
jgi:hypothetical protein